MPSRTEERAFDPDNRDLYTQEMQAARKKLSQFLHDMVDEIVEKLSLSDLLQLYYNISKLEENDDK